MRTQILKDAPSELYRGKAHRHRPLADGRLRPHAFSDADRGQQQFVQHRAGQPRLSSDLKRVLHLSEDLLLPYDHRIQSRGHSKQMANRVLSGQPIQIGGHLLRGYRTIRAYEMHQRLLSSALLLHVGVYLAPIARGQDESLLYLLLFDQEPHRRRPRLRVEHEPIPDLYRRGLVIHSDPNDRHASILRRASSRFPARNNINRSERTS